jgi:hypothetical protein
MATSCYTVVIKRPYFFNENYKSVNLSDRKIVLAFPPDERIVIRNKNDVIDDYGGANAKPESRIRKFYLTQFSASFKSLASGDSVFLSDHAITHVPWDSLAKKEIRLKTDAGSEALLYVIPEKTALQAKGLDSSIFICMQRIEFKRNKFHIEYYWDDKTRKPANLEVILNVIVWDYKNDTPIFYGILAEHTEFHFGLQRKHWDESARDLAKRLIKIVPCL